MTGPRKENRGRNAAAANRRALIAAALEVFADGGFEAPLSAVAKRAGVGQGSLYRHFPDRIGLAVAVFEDNVVQLEAMADDPTSTLDDMLTLITDKTIESVAFVEMVTSAIDDPRMTAVVARVRAALAVPLRDARRSGKVRASVGTDELMLAVSMVAALVAKVSVDTRRETAARAWKLLRRAL